MVEVRPDSPAPETKPQEPVQKHSPEKDTAKPEAPKRSLLDEAVEALQTPIEKVAIAKFADVVAKTKDLDELNVLAQGLLDKQERKEISIGLLARNVCWERVTYFKIQYEKMQAEEKEKEETKNKFVRLDTHVHLHKLMGQTVFHDVPSMVEDPAKKVGSALVGWMDKAESWTHEKSPKVSAFIHEMRYFFGESAPEAAKNIGHVIAGWAERGWYYLWSVPETLGMSETTPFIGGIVNNARDQLKRIDAEGKIEEAVSAEKENNPTVVTFDKKGDKTFWKGLKDAEKSMNWTDQTQQLIAAELKSGNGKTTEKPIVVTLAKLRNLTETTKNAETNAAMERGEKVKAKWGLAKETTVKFEGDKTKVNREGEKLMLTFPNKDAVNEAGEPVAPEAKKLKDVIKSLEDVQEIVIGGKNWEMKKIDAGIGVTFPAVGSDASLPASINIIAMSFKNQERANLFKIDTHELIADQTARLKYTKVGGEYALLWNGSGIGNVDVFLVKKDVLAKAKLETEWEFDGTGWKVSAPNPTT